MDSVNSSPKRLSLRWLLIVPFLLQIIGTVGLVGFLSYRSGQETIHHLARHLVGEVDHRIDQHLDRYLDTPQTLDQTNDSPQHVLGNNSGTDINRFLQTLLPPENGTIFIIDRAGLLIASSDKGSDRLPSAQPAIASQNPTIHHITQALIQKYGNLTAIASENAAINDHLESLSLPDLPPVFVNVNPYQNQNGVDWLVITVISEAYFSDAIQSNAQRTLIVCGLALLPSACIGLVLARLISRPIKQLSQAYEAVAQGRWQDPLPEETTIVELHSLAVSFNQMATQLHQTLQQCEGELEGSRAMYQKIIQVQTDFILRSKPDTTITFANEAFCQAMGVSSEETVGRKWIDALGETEDLQLTISQLATLTPEQPIMITESPDRRAAGQLGWTQWIDQGIFDDQGQLIEIQSVGRDITQLKETEQKLRESQRFIERIAETTPSLLYIYDQIEQRNVYANRSVAEMLGYSRSEIQAMGDRLLQTISHPDDFPKVLSAVQQIQSAQDGDVIETEYRVRSADGEWHWLLSRDIIFSRTADGQVWQTLGTAQDITERKNVEFEVQRIQQFLSSIIENIPDIVFVKEAKTLKYIMLNSAFEKILGYAKADLLNQTDYDLFPAEQAELSVAQDCSILYQGEIVNLPEEIVQANGRENRILRTKKIPIYDESGKAQYLLGISEDVTDRIELENRLTQLARHAPGMLYQFRIKTDGTSSLPYASEGIQTLYGVTPEMVKQDASYCFEVVHPDDEERLQQSITESAEKLTPWRCEFRICLPGKSLTWVLGHATPRRELDGSTTWHGYITDITERKEAENLLIAEKERAEEAEAQLQKAQAHLQQINQKLSQLLNIDTLTKIANRRCFNLRLKQEWLRLQRDQKPLSLILFDVDYFKNYNDYYGHPQGDVCLIRIAQCAKKMVKRPADLVARYGGEEFVVILPDTDEQGAMIVAQRINLAVTKLAIAHQASEIASYVTVSLGIATQIPQADQSVKNLIAQADTALYQAKKQGRNQVVSFASLGSGAD